MDPDEHFSNGMPIDLIISPPARMLMDSHVGTLLPCTEDEREDITLEAAL